MDPTHRRQTKNPLKQHINQPERARERPSPDHKSDFQPLSTSSRPGRPRHPKTLLAAPHNRLTAGATRPSVKLPGFFLPKISVRGYPVETTDRSEPMSQASRLVLDGGGPKRQTAGSVACLFQSGKNSARPIVRTSGFIHTTHA